MTAGVQQLLLTTRENERRLRLAIERDSISLESARRLLLVLERPPGQGRASADSLVAWRREAFKFAALSPLTGTYTALAEGGELNLLRNADLRAQVATYAGELGGDIQEMNGWFETFNRNAQRIIATLPLADLRPIYRGGPGPARMLGKEPLQRALIAQCVISRARLDVLARLLTSTTALRAALERELHTRGG